MSGKIDPLEQEALARELWIERGSPYGDNDRDWFEASEELRAEASNLRRGGSGSELGYHHMFKIASRSIPYVPLFASFQRHDPGPCYRWHEVSLETVGRSYELPLPFSSNMLPAKFQKMLDKHVPSEQFNKCRFESFSTNTIPQGFEDRLTISISCVSYLDYLRSGDYLDQAIDDSIPKETFRQKYMPALPVLQDYRFSPLTNICGVGLFLISSDNKLIVSQQSANISVYPGAYTYTASGSMDWNPWPNNFRGNVSDNPEWLRFLHPFQAITRESWEEVAHEVDPEKIRLFALGIDALKLYFQFSFFEYTHRTSNQIIEHAIEHARDYAHEKRQLKAVEFDLVTLTKLIKRKTWEPAAEAALISLCCRQFGTDEVERAIDSGFVEDQAMAAMCAEWNQRARRRGVMAVMSTGYSECLCPTASESFVSALIDFLGREIDGMDLLEIGPGIGRLTIQLIDKVRALTCIELSTEMIERNKQALGERSSEVNYVCGPVQRFSRDTRFDVVLSSLVLIHNVDDLFYNAFVDRTTSLANVVFLAEHVTGPRHPSSHTKVRSEDQLCADYLKRGFTMQRKQEYRVLPARLLS